jgi:hypothetical protein
MSASVTGEWRFGWVPACVRLDDGVLEPPKSRPAAPQPIEDPKLARSGLLTGPAFIFPVRTAVLGGSVSEKSKDDTTRSPFVHGRSLQR